VGLVYGQRYPATRTSSTSCCPFCQIRLSLYNFCHYSLVCSTNLVGCHCSNVVNTLVWRFFTRHWITFQLFLWIIFQFHHGILEPPMKINLCHCQFVLMSSNIHFFLGPLLIGIPSHWLFVSRSRLSPSTGLCWTRHPSTVADHHDTPVDITPMNWSWAEFIFVCNVFSPSVCVNNILNRLVTFNFFPHMLGHIDAGQYRQENMYFFAWGQISRADGCKNLCDGIELCPIRGFLHFWWQYFKGSPNRGPKCFLGQFVFDVASETCVIYNYSLTSGCAIHSWTSFITSTRGRRHLTCDKLRRMSKWWFLWSFSSYRPDIRLESRVFRMHLHAMQPLNLIVLSRLDRSIQSVMEMLPLKRGRGIAQF